MRPTPVLTVLLTALALTALSVPPAAAADLGSTRPWWIFFQDKGLGDVAEEEAAVRSAEAALTPRALARRAQARPGGRADLLDVPLHEPYVNAVLAAGAAPRVRARWLNALSVDATEQVARAVEALPFVDAVRPVATARRSPVPVQPVQTAARPSGRSLNYGACSSQILPIQVDQLHDAGYTGAGVLICVTDTGFLLDHDAFTGIDVQAAWDFVNDDAVVENEGSDLSNQHNHGTWVLSLLGGYDPGNLIGPAYGATYLLAKTESMDFEMQVEEDYWIAAAQWADSLGADIISTSLGYNDWYTYADLDGDTAPITIAADLAVANGISVITSAGNEGDDAWYYVNTPADGDSVAAIGAVDSLGVIVDFSSHGPTFDGRTKPDVCAMGRGTLIVSIGDPHAYYRGSGTSFSCPIVAGAVALLKEARPLWGPMEILEALRATATRAGTPDNEYGWGVIQAADALNRPTGVSEKPAALPGARISVSPNPSARTSVIRWSLPDTESGDARLTIHDVVGRRVRELWRGPAAGPGASGWDGRDESGRLVSGGIYFARLQTERGTRTARVIRIR